MAEDPPAAADDLFAFVYAAPTAALVEQRAALRGELEERTDG
jgi:hypothetical protein